MLLCKGGGGGRHFDLAYSLVSGSSVLSSCSQVKFFLSCTSLSNISKDSITCVIVIVNSGTGMHLVKNPMTELVASGSHLPMVKSRKVSLNGELKLYEVSTSKSSTSCCKVILKRH